MPLNNSPSPDLATVSCDGMMFQRGGHVEIGSPHPDLPIQPLDWRISYQTATNETDTYGLFTMVTAIMSDRPRENWAVPRRSET